MCNRVAQKCVTVLYTGRCPTRYQFLCTSQTVLCAGGGWLVAVSLRGESGHGQSLPALPGWAAGQDWKHRHQWWHWAWGHHLPTPWPCPHPSPCLFHLLTRNYYCQDVLLHIINKSVRIEKRLLFFKFILALHEVYSRIWLCQVTHLLDVGLLCTHAVLKSYSLVKSEPEWPMAMLRSLNLKEKNAGVGLVLTEASRWKCLHIFNIFSQLASSLGFSF